MKSLRALLKDRRRSQQGSVLGGVLIITAFLAILSGALMTELSTNFLLSTDLVNRVNTEATVSSAVEMYINQLQNTQLYAPCPGPISTPVLNGQMAVATIAGCAAVIDRRSPQSFTTIASSKPFQIDGTHAQLPGLNDYLVGDAGGKIFDYTYGGSTPRWTLPLGGSVTGTPLVMPDASHRGQFLDLIPASGPACSPAPFCVSVQSDDGSSSVPDVQCTMATTAAVASQPASGRNWAGAAYFGDSSGSLYAIDPTSGSTCEIEGTKPAGDPIVAGPVVFRCANGCGGQNPDEIYVVTSSGGSSHLVRFTYTNSNLSQVGIPLPLPWARASGIAVESSGLPSKLAISFSGGQVAVIQIATGGGMSIAATGGVPAGIGGAPFWCQCPGTSGLIGVGGDNGTLYVFDTTMTTYATYSGGSAIRTTPGADGAGNWYFAADDGRLYEVQKTVGGAMTLAVRYGSQGSPIGSSPVVGPCQVGICVYFGSTNSNAYLVSLDARNAVFTACISAAPPTCSGTNPRLWTRAEIGVSGNAQTVHIQGWSYYAG